MAAIEVRARRDGCTSYRLKWRFGGKRQGAPQSVTYTELEDAKRMKGAVEALGHLVYAEDPRVQTFELVTGQRPTSYAAPTFGEVADRYIKSRTRASAASRDRYRQAVARLSQLVNRPVEAITDEDLQCVINAITDTGRSATFTYELLCSVFKFAVNKGILPGGNPCAYLEAPKKRSRTANFLTSAEAGILVRKCRADANRAVGIALGHLVEVILGTGLRLSEALGLIVADVHLDDMSAAWLDVDQQLSRPTRKNLGMCRVPLKTQAGQRRIVLDPDTARLLARLIIGKHPGDPVFPDPVDGGWWAQYRVDHAWARARQAARTEGLAKCPRIHDLRHTHAAWLLTAGVPLLAVSRRLGHESIKVTADVYGHLLPEADDVIRGAVAGQLAVMAGKANRPGNRKARNTRPGTRTKPERTTSQRRRVRSAAAPRTTIGT